MTQGIPKNLDKEPRRRAEIFLAKNSLTSSLFPGIHDATQDVVPSSALLLTRADLWGSVHRETYWRRWTSPHPSLLPPFTCLFTHPSASHPATPLHPPSILHPHHPSIQPSTHLPPPPSFICPSPSPLRIHYPSTHPSSHHSKNAYCKATVSPVHRSAKGYSSAP